MSPMAILDGLRNLRAQTTLAAEEIFQPAPRITVSEWADDNRILPPTAAEPGRFRTARLPYLRRIQDVLGDERVREVVFAKGAQIAGSTVGENFLGYIIDQAPSAVLEVWPTEKKLRSWTLTRLDPMLEDTPCLAAKFPRTGRRTSEDSLSFKGFPGGWIKAITAKSTSDLKSDSSRVAIAEEVDEWDPDIGDQGDPLELLRARMRTFWNSKLYVVSTPTLDASSRIWKLLQASTWEEFWVPCPHCDHLQTLRWRDSDGDGSEAGAYRIIFDRTEYGEVVEGSAKYLCEECGALIDDSYKSWMLEEGEKRQGAGGGWVPRYPGRQTVGFHLSTLYSPLVSWDKVAAAFLRAKQSPPEMKTFVNTFLGLPYQEAGEEIAAHFLQRRAEPYAAEVPHGVGLLTAFVDVQGDRLELFVWGWGADERAWVIRWEQLDGDPGQDAVWRTLDEWRLRAWQHEDGAKLHIQVCAIDAGYQAERVWRYAAARAHQKVIATVGRDGRGRKLIEAPTPDKFKRSKSRKKPMHVIGTDSGKDLLAARLRITDPTLAGYIHFPESLDSVFYDQLTAEKLVTKYKRGRPVRVWDLPAGRRNEALDGAVGNMAALAYLGQKVIRQLGALADQVSAQGRALQTGAAAPAAAPRPTGRRVLSSGIS